MMSETVEKTDLLSMDPAELEAFCKHAVRLSGYSVLKKGAIPSIPDYNI